MDSMPSGLFLELYRGQRAKAAVTALAVVKDLQVVELRLASSTRCASAGSRATRPACPLRITGLAGVPRAMRR